MKRTGLFFLCACTLLAVSVTAGAEEAMAENSIQAILEKVKWDKAEEPIMNSLNELIDKENEGTQYFFPYYSEEEIAADETKHRQESFSTKAKKTLPL